MTDLARPRPGPALQLLERASAAGVRLWAEDGQLRFRAPRGALTPQLRAALSEQQAELLALLQHSAPVPAGAVVLSAGQRRWWLQQGLGAHIAAVVELRGALDVQRLAEALCAIVGRHEPLRTVVEADARGELVGRLLPAPASWPLPVEEIAAEQAGSFAAAEAELPFDVSKGPLLRARLAKLGPDCHRLVVTVHHMAADGWSLGVLVRELGALYAQERLPPLALRYSEVAAWQQAQPLEPQVRWWRTQLQGVPAIELPRGDCGAVSCSHELAPAVAQLLAQRKSEGLTAFMLLQAALWVLLARLSGQQDFAVGTPVANRGRAQWESLVGFFVNTVVLRSPLPQAGERVQELWQAVRSRTLEALAHQELAFDALVRALQPARQGQRNPFFDVLLAVQNAPLAPLQLPGLQALALPSPLAASRLPLEIHGVPHGQGRWSLVATAQAGVLGEAGCRRLLAQLEAVLQRMLLAPQARWRELAGLDEASAQEVARLEKGPQGKQTTPWLQLVCAHAGSTAPAYLSDEGSLRFADLCAQAARWAQRLREAGVGRQVPVGLLLERSPEQAVLTLAVWWAGGVYVPLDPRWPPARIAQLLQASGIGLVIARGDVLAALRARPGLRCWDLAEEQPSERGAPPAPRCPDDGLYLLFTSGSTGTPKAVLVPDRVLDNLCAWQASTAGPLRTLQFAALGFDVSIQELLSAWTQGQAVVGLREAERGDARAVLAAIARHGPQRLYLPVVMLHALAEAALLQEEVLGVREIVTAGEALRVTPAVRAWARREGFALHNQYGPTESHVVSAHVLRGDPTQWPDRPPIGKPIANARLRVVDAEGCSLPVGWEGELWIEGEVLAHGYWGQPGRSAERFVAAHGGARAYRSGDRCRWDEDGQLHYLGRSDQQVKVRGFRVELGEVEAQLRALPEVRQAVVVLQQGDLAAYVEPHRQDPELARQLRAQLARRLPQFMVPTRWSVLPSLPRNANGKLERRALPPAQPLQATQDAQPPQGATEQALARLWSDLLELPASQIHRGDDFFALGGHSLKATQLATRIARDCGVALPLASLFEHPVLQDMAAAIDAAAPEALPPLELAPRDAPLPLSFAQERLWFLDQLAPGQSAYNMPAALRLRGQLDVPALQRTFAELLRRHESLRTAFASVDGRAVQRIAPAPEHWPLAIEDLPGPDLEGQAKERALEEARRPFDLRQAPLLRTRLLRLGPQDHVLLATLHHITADGWSLGVLVRELSALYTACARNEAPTLQPLERQYADFAVWQRQWLDTTRLQQELAYWGAQLQELPALDLPTDRPRPATQSYRGASCSHALPASLAERVQRLAQQHRATPFMVLMAAWQALLARISGQRDITVGTALANRLHPQTEPMIGFFVNSVALRTRLDQRASFEQLVRSVRATALDAYAHQAVPFEKVVEQLQPARDASRHPLFQVAFTLQNAPAGTLQLHALTLAPFEAPTSAARFDLEVHVWAHAAGFSLVAVYATDLWDGASVAAMLAQFEALLTAALAAPDQPFTRLPLVPPHSRHAIALAGWGPRAAEPPDCVHRRFAAIAQRQPQATAVVCGDTRLSYCELDILANRIAHALRQRGIAPEQRVAIHIERSCELAAAILGVWKAGGAYVPLDPLQPADRLARILADSRPVLRLTRGALAGALPQDATPVLDLAQLTLEHLPSAPPPDRTLPRHLAYVLYTSGSTGEPKGVLVEHAGIDNLQRAQIAALGIRPDDRALLFASVGFDASVSELLLGLLAGAALVIAPAEAARSVEALAALLQRERVSVATLTPSLLAALDGEFPALRLLLTAGEPCPQPVARRWSAGRALVNAYGPTEATVAVTMSAPIAADDPLAPALGPPIAGVFACVLDECGQLLPDGVPGELCVGGAGVARGYRGQPGLTAERFIPDAWSGTPGGRLYRTGDRVVRHANGRLAYLGRLDQQLKIRGQRAEPAEIEAALRRHPDVVDAAVALTEQAAAVDILRVAPSGGPVEWWPSIAEHFVYDETMYHAMTHDEVRNAHYRAAFEAAVPGRTVVDVGTGADAILARMCVAAGARHVYAIERLEASWRSAQATVRRLGLADRITVIHGDATSVQLPEPVDLCVSEIVGPIGGAEGSAAILNEAWRFLRPGGRMIPARTVSRVAAVELPPGALEQPAFNPLTADYTRRIFAQAGGPFDLRLCVKGLSSADLLSDSAVFEDLDHEAGRVPLESAHAVELTVTRDGFGAGLLVWLQLHATPAQCLDTLDVNCCWLPVFLPAFGTGVALRAGSRIRCRVVRTLAANRLNPDFVVEGTVERQGAPAQAFRFESPHGRALGTGSPRFRASPFYERLFRDPAAPSQRLVAWLATRYAQPQAGGTEAALQQARIAGWRDLYENAIEAAGEEESLSGWNSSYTGAPLPAAEMRAWRDATVRRIRALRPRQLWEVGCGNGLLLWPLAPDCTSYRGTDFSAAAIDALRRRVGGTAWRHVTLDVGEAAEVLRAATPGGCDTLVLNSVVQYFPGLAHLGEVLAQTARVLAAGGTAFVGDVRGRPWLEAFHASVARAGGRDAAQARSALAAEEELAVDPAWFTALDLPGLRHVEVRLKDEATANELSWFRYDVVLHFGTAPAQLHPAQHRAWNELGNLTALEDWLHRHAGQPLACLQVPNGRVLPHLEAASGLGLLPARAWPAGLALDAVQACAARCGASVRLAPAASGDPAFCDALFEWDDTQRAAAWQRPPLRAAGVPANNPLRRQQEDLLREQLPRLLRESLPEALVPGAYVFLDALPRGASGKLDRRALPAPEASTSRRATTLPRDALEAGIASLWQDVLGVDQVGVDEDFFLLGGHSLLAVQLMARIRERFGVQLPLALLLQHGTVAGLAQKLRADGAAPGYTPLVPLRPRGERPALFFLHPGGGGPLCYRPLVDLLPPAWPAYGLQPAGLEPGEQPLESMEAIAASYVAAIHALQPEGPYHLVGWSFGGHVAYEMACQLRAAGRTMGLLALIDAMAPEHVPRVDPRMQSHAAQLAYLARLAGLDVSAQTLEPLAEATQVALVADRASAAGLLPGGSTDTVGRMLKLSQVSGNLSRSYRPGRYDGTLHFLRAAEAMTPELAEVARHHPAGSWDRYAREVRVQVVPGDHRSVMQPPHLAALAQALRQLLPD